MTCFVLTQKARDLILEFECGGRGGYNPHPEWPGASSGVTIGIGYDLGYYTEEYIRAAWAKLPANDLNRLAKTRGAKGQSAQILARSVRDISIPWDIALDVFQYVTIPQHWAHTLEAFPGVVKLPPDAQGALLSLVFNRGASLEGPRRREMLAIRTLTGSATPDLHAIAQEVRAMTRLWIGSSIEKGMRRRRNAEADLIEGRG